MRLIVHIGANKTGSSAIQRFLGLHASVLQTKGILVPNQRFELSDSVSGAHVFGFEELFRDSEGKDRFTAAITALAKSADNASTIIVSAENLAASPKAPSLFLDLAKTFDIHLVCYIRRQDEYLVSAWQQWHSKISNDFWAWATSIVGILGNWQVYLENWEQVIPREHMTIKVFERHKLIDQDIVADFACQAGLDVTDLDTKVGGLTNPSFSDAIMDLVKGNNLIFDNVHDNDFYAFVKEFTGNRYIKDSKSSFLTIKQRQALLGRYKVSNQNVKHRYFSPAVGELFSSIDECNYHYTSERSVSDEKMEFVTSVLYKMYTKYLRTR